MSGDSLGWGIVAIGSRLYFLGSSGTTYGLLESDGTAAGTRFALPLPSRPDGFRVEAAGGLFFFTLNEPGTGEEPWVSDGTLAGTQGLGDLCPGLRSSMPHGFREFGGRVFFVAEDPGAGRELWVTDGTPVEPAASSTSIPAPPRARTGFTSRGVVSFTSTVAMRPRAASCGRRTARPAEP